MKKKIDWPSWIGATLSTLVFTGTILGIFINLRLQPIFLKIENIEKRQEKQEERLEKESGKQEQSMLIIHKMASDVAVMKNNYQHLYSLIESKLK